MVRVAGVNIPQNKRGETALTYILGIGRSSANKILQEAQIEKDKRVADWTDEEANSIRAIISKKYKVEGDLKAETRLNIKRLIDIGAYRGQRHRLGLPTRGQKTKNNSRTRKGKRKTVANKKKAMK